MSFYEAEFVREGEIDNLREFVTKSFEDWRAAHEDALFEEIPKDKWSVFVPRHAYEASLNPAQVQTRPVGDPRRKIEFVTVDSSYPDVLTDPKDWEKWLDFEKTRRPGQVPPPEFASLKIDPLHREYRWMIESGEVGLQDKIIMTADMYTVDEQQEVLRVGNYGGIKGQGLGKEFYKKTLPDVAIKMGIRYIVGENNDTNIGFFTSTETGLGRVTIDAIRPEFRSKFFPHETDLEETPHPYHTVQFLFEEDKNRYLV
jgi:hypothetical protein